MTIHRFFVPPAALAASTVVVEGTVARQMAVVLRLRRGEEVVLLDGLGNEVWCVLGEVAPRRVTARQTARRQNQAESSVAIHLFPALIRAPRLELVLQKATELGVASVTPFVSRRSVARLAPDGVPDRWRAIVREASEQSGRGRLPELQPPVNLATACRLASGADLAICCSEYGGEDLRLLCATPGLQSVSVLVGPEGGLEPEEVAAATEHGICPVALGPRVLRAETAAIAVCSAIYCLLGEWPSSGCGVNAQPPVIEKVAMHAT